LSLTGDSLCNSWPCSPKGAMERENVGLFCSHRLGLSRNTARSTLKQWLQTRLVGEVALRDEPKKRLRRKTKTMRA